MTAPRVSVVVVSYNVESLLARCLDAVVRHAGVPCDLWVVDNASTDASVELVRREFPAANLLINPTNLGFSCAVNRAVAQARGDALLLLNPDTELLPGALESLLAALVRPGVGAVGARQVDGAGFFQLAWGAGPGLLSEGLRRWVQRRLDAGDRRVATWVDALAAQQRRVAWVAGSSMLVRRDAFTRVGGFDEGFFLFFEDIDFCLRLGAAGLAVLYEPAATVLHHRGASARQAPQAAAAAYRASQRRFWRKHGHPLAARLVAAYTRLRG